jgi:hypothetical protein
MSTNERLLLWGGVEMATLTLAIFRERYTRRALIAIGFLYALFIAAVETLVWLMKMAFGIHP